MKTFNYILTLAVLFSLYSCTKYSTDPPAEDLDKNFLTFSNEDEMMEELHSVLEMSSGEKYQWEKSRKFNSLELASERIYESIDPEQFESQEEVFDFVKANRHYLKLTEDGKGEYELDTRLSRSPFRYFANLDDVFKVNEHFYKVFQEGIVAVPENMYDALVDSDFQSALGIDNHRVVYASGLSLKKSTKASCQGTTVRTDNGNERTRFIHEPTYYNMGSYFHAAAGYEIRGYRRVLGIWYRVTRTLSCDIDMTVLISGESYQGWYQKSGFTAQVLEGAYKIPNAYFYSLGACYYDAYDSWGQQQNTGKAYAYCT